MTDRVSLAGHDAAAAWTAFQRIAREHERESKRDERSSVERTFARAIETAEVAGEQESLSREIADQMKPIDSAIQLAGAAAAIAGGVVTVAAAAGGVVAMCTGVGAPIGVAVEAVAVGTAAGSASAGAAASATAGTAATATAGTAATATAGTAATATATTAASASTAASTASSVTSFAGGAAIDTVVAMGDAAIGSVLSGNLLSLGPNVAQAGVQSAARSLGDVLFGELARSGVGSLVDTILGTATKTGASGAGEAAQAGREAARTVGDATNELARSAGDATNELARSASDAPKTLEDQLRARFDEATKPENVLGEVKKRGEQLRDGVLEARRSEGRTRGQNAAHTREVAAASEARADATRQRLDGAREDATSIDHLRHDLAATAVRVLG